MIRTLTCTAAAALACASALTSAPAAHAGTETGHCVWTNDGRTATVSARLSPSDKYGDASKLLALAARNYGPSGTVRITVTDSNTGKNIGRFTRTVASGRTATITFPATPEYTIPWGSTLKATFTAAGGHRCVVTLGL